MLVDKKHVKSEQIIKHSELEAVIDQSQSSPHPHNLVTEKRFFNTCLVLMRPNSEVNVLSMRYNATISVPPCEDTIKIF